MGNWEGDKGKKNKNTIEKDMHKIFLPTNKRIPYKALALTCRRTYMAATL